MKNHCSIFTRVKYCWCIMQQVYESQFSSVVLSVTVVMQTEHPIIQQDLCPEWHHPLRVQSRLVHSWYHLQWICTLTACSRNVLSDREQGGTTLRPERPNADSSWPKIQLVSENLTDKPQTTDSKVTVKLTPEGPESHSYEISPQWSFWPPDSKFYCLSW